MKPLKHLTTILLSALLLSMPTAHAEDDKVLAVINGKEITGQAFSGYAMMRLQQVQHRGEISNEQRQLLFQEYINSELLYQDAVKTGVDKSPAVNAELELQKRAIIINHSLKAHVDNKLTENSLKETYDAEYGKGATEYHTRHILVENESDANNILAALERGEDFKKLAATSSVDPSGSEGGDLGWLSPGDMPPAFAAAVETMKEGARSTAAVKSNFGWHIIQLEEKRTINPPAFEAVAQELESKLQGQVVKEYIDGLRKDASIEIK